MPLTAAEEREVAEYERRLMAAPIAEQVEMIHQFRDELVEKYAADPVEMTEEDWAEVNELVASYERQHIDHVVNRFNTIDPKTIDPLELGDLLWEWIDAVCDNREYASERYQIGQPEVKQICIMANTVSQKTEPLRRARDRKELRQQEAASRLKNYENNAISDFLLDEADLAKVRSFFLPPDAQNKQKKNEN